MSAFFVWLELSEQRIDKAVVSAMHQQLAPFGGDAQELHLSANFAVSVQARWTTPEDVGEQQPLYNSKKTQCFVFDGRIDNRAHLITELQQCGELSANDAGHSFSDASLLFTFLTRFGEARLAEVIGPFVFVWVDLASNELRAARDTMGGRYLAFFQSDQRLIVASTELAFLKYPDIGHVLNKKKVAGWLINRQEGKHTSCLKGLSVVNPGNRLFCAEANGWRTQQHTFYRPNPERHNVALSDHEYAQEFRRLLDQAVKRRLRSRTEVGCMLSGGMDSVPIAISAALSESDVGFSAYSWVFNDSPEMDERRYSTPVCERFGIEQVLIECDHLWPKFDHDTHNNPLFPFALPYAEFQQRTLDAAANNGAGVMLSGLQGDLLYETQSRQVLDALSQGEFKLALSELKTQKNTHSLTWWNTIKRFVIMPSGIMQRWLERRHSRQSVTSEWLNEERVNEFSYQKHWLFDVSQKALRPLQYRVVLDGFAGEDAMLGRHMENKYRVERRYPFRDRDLCEFLLSVPTSQLAKLGLTRPIVKRAYRSEFTDDLVKRNDKTQFVQSLLQGIKKDHNLSGNLHSTPSFWQEYVKECYINDETTSDDTKTVVKWRCAYYNFWYRVWYR